jgi:hypothetical protein
MINVHNLHHYKHTLCNYSPFVEEKCAMYKIYVGYDLFYLAKNIKNYKLGDIRMGKRYGSISPLLKGEVAAKRRVRGFKIFCRKYLFPHPPRFARRPLHRER